MGDDVGASFKSKKNKKKKAKRVSVPESPDISQSRRKKRAVKTKQDDKRGGGDELLSTLTDRIRANFQKFMMETFMDGTEKIMREYDSEIKPYFPPDLRRTAFDANPDKNRYKDIVCNDNSRVVLEDGKGGDYIHANYVRGEPLHNTFICTQGPMERTLVDFVRMIVQEKVRTILMLCELSEGGKKKCERYWPDKVGDRMQIGDVVITKFDSISNDANVEMSVLEFQPSDRPKAIVRHYQWRTWPDRSVPRSMQAVAKVILPFLRVARVSKNATLVHCSAGIGRTGTVVGIEMCIQRLFSDREFRRTEVIRLLKDQRCHSVQMDIQYVFIMTAVCEFAKENGVVENADTLDKYRRYLDEYENMLARRVLAEGSHTF